jgi:hypothetical protein
VFYRYSRRPVSMIPILPSPKKYVTLTISPCDEVTFPAPIMMPLKENWRIPQMEDLCVGCYQTDPEQPLRAPCRTSQNAPYETVWKIGIRAESGIRRRLRGGEEAQIGRFLESKKHGREACGHFPNSFYSIT